VTKLLLSFERTLISAHRVPHDTVASGQVTAHVSQICTDVTLLYHCL